jgi:LacI family transcriptional regulator
MDGVGDRLPLPRPGMLVLLDRGFDTATFLTAAEESGLRVPEDLTVTGYDNIYVSTINRISLTTVDQSGPMTGSVSARLLLERINGHTQPVRYVVAPRLVARSTSASPAGLSPPPPTRGLGSTSSSAR